MSAVIMDEVNNDMSLKDTDEECEQNFIIKKSVLCHKKHDREINNVRKMIATLHIDSSNKKILLSKSEKKRLRKKRQALAKQNIRKTENGIVSGTKSSVLQTQIEETQNPPPIIKQYGNQIKSDKFVLEKCKEFEPLQNNLGCQTNVKSQKQSNQHSIYSFIVSGKSKKLSTKDIIWLLQLQNLFLTNQWVVLQRKDISSDESMITVGIDPNSESLLKSKNHQASLLRSTIFFRKKSKNFIKKTRNPAKTRTNKLDTSTQSEDKPFSFLGKWQTFTTSLNRMD